MMHLIALPYQHRIYAPATTFFPRNHWACFLGLAVLLALPYTGLGQSKPNIVLILADDLGYGDVSCYNASSKIKTVHLDRLAREGMLFTDAHSGSAVCTPTRYGLLTGRYSWRGSLKNGVLQGYSPPLIENNRLTVGKLLQQNGYQTACIGKWHLGLEWQRTGKGMGDVDFSKPLVTSANAFGFDYFFGISASLDMPPYVYVENDRVTAFPTDSTESKTEYGWWRKGITAPDFKHDEVLDMFIGKANAFISTQAKEKKPFFLYLPLAAPHTPILPTAPWKGQSGLNEYGDFVMMVDDAVGKILQTLKDNDLDKNTLVIFTSDNGCAPYAGTMDMEKSGHRASAQFRGYKADIYEGGHRIPFVVKWPGTVRPGSRSDQTVCLTDIMGTVASVLESTLPSDAGEDSYDLMPLFQGKKMKGPFREGTIHQSVNGSLALRAGKWKLVFTQGSGGWSSPKPGKESEGLPPIQLFDLDADPSEKTNLQAQYPEVARKLTALMDLYRDSGRSAPQARAVKRK